jgi:hypothetical protein
MIKTYQEIVSIGSSCCPGLSLRKLNYKGETYPFDWIRSNSKIIYDVIINGSEKYTTFNSKISNDYIVKDIHSYTHPEFDNRYINYYGQYFTHYTEINNTDLVTKFKRYMERFFELLNSNKKVLFIHSNEEYIYHKKSRDNKTELYEYLCKINDILERKYPNLNFQILNIDINNFTNFGNIVNFNFEYNLPFSDYCENHTADFYEPYRRKITEIIEKYIKDII